MAFDEGIVNLGIHSYIHAHLAKRLGLNTSRMNIQIMIFSRLRSCILSRGQIDGLVFCLLIAQKAFDQCLLISEIQIEGVCQIDFGDTWFCNAVNLVCLFHGDSGALISVHLLA